jgi:iron(III) transport system ATP-binding protein
VPAIEVTGLVKSYAATSVLQGIDFSVADGELLTMLGPSGCGKSTTLMCIAGLQTADAGTIRVGEETFFDAARKIDVPAEQRNLGLVFQSYAIWPHMTVFENVAFPLKLRRVPGEELRRRVHEALDLVEIDAHSKRYPHELSGGQQQRVALARALGFSPRVLLLDEPFSNLDAKLRERARDSVRELQLRLHLTTIFVTHDQDEALSMSDRVLVMNQGRILQTGTPESIYQHPADPFVAEFVGRCNFLRGTVSGPPARGSLDVAIEGAGISLRVVDPQEGPRSGTITVAIRPEAIELVRDGEASGEDVFRGAVDSVTFLGDHYRYAIRVGEARLVVVSSRRVEDEHVLLRVAPADCTVMP